MTHMLNITLDKNDRDKHFTTYKGRKIYISPLADSRDKPAAPVIAFKGLLEGHLTVHMVKTFDGYTDEYRHTIHSGDYKGYVFVLDHGFKISVEEFNKRFYPHYYKEDGDRIWRCPTRSLDEAWEHSEEYI